MLRVSVLLILLSHRIRTAYVTERPSFADRLDKLYEKLEKFTVAPLTDTSRDLTKSPREKLYEKLDRLNSLTPERVDFSDDDEELLTAMQMWGMLSAEQLEGVMKDLQGVREAEDEKNERGNEGDYNDSEWTDEELQEGEGDYPMDWYADEEPDASLSTSKPVGVTPSAFTRQDAEYRETVVSAVDPIAATNERPRILDDSALTPMERSALRRAIYHNMAMVVRAGKCREPQPRWLNVRQLAPAANIVYMPPCVQLHRCAPDAGCCYDEGEVCAPVAGEYVNIPFFLHKADGNMSAARMRFFNHTQCACVSRETLQSTVRTRVDSQHKRENQETRKPVRESQSDNRPPTDEPALEKDEPTAPPQLRRCTCPTLFLGRITDKGQCSCVCEWTELNRRRDCLSLARGREHFGLRDRVCVINGDCTSPTCEYGAYDRSTGRCPLRRFRRTRYHHHGRNRLVIEKTLEV